MCLFHCLASTLSLLSCVSLPTQRNSANYSEQFCRKFCAQCQLRTLHRCVRLRPCLSLRVNIEHKSSPRFTRGDQIVVHCTRFFDIIIWLNGYKCIELSLWGHFAVVTLCRVPKYRSVPLHYVTLFWCDWPQWWNMYSISQISFSLNMLTSVFIMRFRKKMNGL